MKRRRILLVMVLLGAAAIAVMTALPSREPEYHVFFSNLGLLRWAVTLALHTGAVVVP